jgi:hypothetical protein
MPLLAPGSSSAQSGVSRSMVKGLFVSSCLLSIVSWYTTQQGMALYLSPWFALLASRGLMHAGHRMGYCRRATHYSKG